MAVRRPVLVTGVPRSGTTWLARELAAAPRAALPGREPMNPRPGQFALGGTLTSWTPLHDPTGRQVAVLRRAYRGREVRTYSRYGVKQWSAALPWTTTVVKDPFALLAVPTIVRETAAKVVIVYRHPGAVLTSYRRVGWTAGAAEVRAPRLATGAGVEDDAAAMVEFWVHMHEQVLGWIDSVPGCLLVSHAEASLAGPEGMAALRRAVGLRPAAQVAVRTGSGSAPPELGLHRFDRAPEEVAEGWRQRLGPQETELVERGAADVLAALDRRRFRLLP